VSLEEILKLLAVPSVTVLCVIVWTELRGVRKAIHNGNNAVQEILVKALTGELKSFAEWKADRIESGEGSWKAK